MGTLISRLFIKNHLGFKEVSINFGDGLNVFTGVSGAGKSVLMGAILAVFGFGESEAKLIEIDVEHEFDLSEFGIENEEINTFKFLRDKSARYFINNQSISKKKLASTAATHLKYLSAKEISEFENERLLNAIDTLVTKINPEFTALKAEFTREFAEFTQIKKELNKILEDEKKVEELKEFASFEIEKIASISPKIGELDELMQIKKRLSRKDKIEEAWNKANQIFSLENRVLEALNMSDIDAAFFSDTMNELRNIRAGVNFDDLEDLDIEKILDRIEALNSLEKRYGSIEEALSVLETRKKELMHYEKIEFEKSDLQARFSEKSAKINELTAEISAFRKARIPNFEAIINKYLKALYMENVSVNLKNSPICSLGLDAVEISLKTANLKNLSSGELNRLRLAFIASEVEILEFGSGVLILDEIDSNLSGKEAMSVADVLLKLAKYYQIFAISHQPQLSSRANHHFLVEKIGEISSVRELDKDERIGELSRMISGEKISEEATSFAKKLLD